jgi:hypothetical protein
MEMRENEQFWLDPPGNEGLVPLCDWLAADPSPKFHACVFRGGVMD